VNVNMNVMTSVTSKKQDSPKQSNKSEEFKKILDNQELNSKNSSNDSVQKKYNKDQNDNKVNKDELDKSTNKNQGDDVENKDIEKATVEGNTSKDLKNPEDNVDPKTKIISLIEAAIDKLKKTTEGSLEEIEGSDKPTDQMAEIQQLLQLLSSMLQNVSEVSPTMQPVSEPNSINLGSVKLEEQVMGAEKLMDLEKLTPDAKSVLKSNLSEIVALMDKSKGNNLMPSEITNVLQKLTTVVEDLKGDLSLLKVPSLQTLSGNSEDKSISDSILKKVIELTTKTSSEALPQSQIQSSNDSSKGSKFSENSSSEEKFLKNLLSGDKDESKISKAVNFMNQFETVKTIDTAKVQTVNLVIDKSDFTVDVIKNIKFMEINNIKDLTVKMNPKELGEITIKLTMESGIMKASISAQNKETFNLLNQNIQDISDKLKNMDIKIQSLDINIYEDSTFFNKDSNGKNNNGSKNNYSGTNSGSEEEDISISNNYAIEENQVNKFV